MAFTPLSAHEPALLAASELLGAGVSGPSRRLGRLGFARASSLMLSRRRFSTVCRPRSDAFLLRTLQPRLAGQRAAATSLRGSLSRFVLEQTVLLLGVIVLWSLAATAGRAATLRHLVAMFGTEEEPQSMEWRFAPIFVLQLLRVMWTMIAVGRGVRFVPLRRGDGAGRASDARGVSAVSRIGCAVSCHRLELVLRGRAAILYSKWRGRNGSSGAGCRFCCWHAGRLFLLAVGFFALRLAWFGMMCLAFFSPLSWISRIGGRWTTLLMAIVALTYFAGADLLVFGAAGSLCFAGGRRFTSCNNDRASKATGLESTGRAFAHGWAGVERRGSPLTRESSSLVG